MHYSIEDRWTFVIQTLQPILLISKLVHPFSIEVNYYNQAGNHWLCKHALVHSAIFPFHEVIYQLRAVFKFLIKLDYIYLPLLSQSNSGFIKINWINCLYFINNDFVFWLLNIWWLI